MSEESVNVTIKKDGQSVSPVYVDEVDVGAIGSSTRVTDGCGNTSNRDTNATGWQVTISGILTNSQWQTIRDMELKGSSANLITDPISDKFIIEDVNVTQTDKLNRWVSDRKTKDDVPSAFENLLDDSGSDGPELAYNFQIKTKDESNEGV